MARVHQAPGDPQDLLDLQEQELDLHLSTWRVPGSLIWSLCGDPLGHPVLLVLLDFPWPLVEPRLLVLEHSGPQGKMEHLVNLVCLAYQVLMANLELLVPRERRVIQASLGFQVPLEQRESQVSLVYRAVQERLDWQVFLDRWGRLGVLALLVLLEEATALDLMTWRDLEALTMDFLVLEDQKEYRVLRAYQDFQVNLDCLDYKVLKAVKVPQEETGSQDWMDSPDLRDKRETAVAKERGVKQVETELDFQVPQVHQDHRDKSSISHQITLIVLLAELVLRVGLVYLDKLDFLVPLVQKVTEEIRVFQVMV